MKNKNPRQQVVRLLSLLLFIATVVFFHRCRQPSAAQAFIPENIRERTQQPYLSWVFKEADSLKYELDYFNAANRYHSQLASACLHFHEKIYAFNHLSYLYLIVNMVDIAFKAVNNNE